MTNAAITSLCLTHINRALEIARTDAANADAHFKSAWDSIAQDTMAIGLEEYAGEVLSVLEAEHLRLLFDKGLIIEAVAAELKDRRIEGSVAIHYALKNYKARFKDKDESLDFINRVTARLVASIPPEDGFESSMPVAAFLKKYKLSLPAFEKFMLGWRRSADYEHAPLKLALYFNFIRETEEFAQSVARAQSPQGLMWLWQWCRNLFGRSPLSPFVNYPKILLHDQAALALPAGDFNLNSLSTSYQFYVGFESAVRLHYVLVPNHEGELVRMYVPPQYMGKDRVPTLEFLQATDLLRFDMPAFVIAISSALTKSQKIKLYKEGLLFMTNEQLTTFRFSPGDSKTEAFLHRYMYGVFGDYHVNARFDDRYIRPMLDLQDSIRSDVTAINRAANPFKP